MPPSAPAAALASAYRGYTDLVTHLSDLDLLLPSGCRGWTIADLTVHLALDAQRALVTLASPADGPPDVDHITYWRDFPGGDAEATLRHTQWVRRTAAAYERPSDVVRHWTDLAQAAVRAAAAADPATTVSTQGHVLTVGDFLATLVTEAVIHHLDAMVSLPDAADPRPDAMTIARSTMDGLCGPLGLPPSWPDRVALLKASGRSPLDPADRAALGARADRFPLIG